MKPGKRWKKIFAVFVAGFVLSVTGAGENLVQAATGTVYTCVVHPCYAHPVTGEIEDSGGESSYATGQGMVEGVIDSTGILELTDSGEYYLTIRMSLMDSTSNHSFWVQDTGDSQWASPAVGVTGNGTDSNGTTADVCVQVPSENCIVRVAMHVDPMGRDVVFYLYPSDYVEGNSTDMTPAIVTMTSGEESTTANGGENNNSMVSEPQSVESEASSQNNTSPAESESGDSAGASSQGDSTENESERKDSTENESVRKESTESTTHELSSSITEAANPQSDISAESTLRGAQGLSLSTEEGTQEGSKDKESLDHDIFAVGITVTFSGLILMGAAASIIYFFRRNWRRWGGAFDDDDE